MREYEKNRNYEINEMIELYQNEGLEFEDAEKIVNIVTSNDKYKDFFIKSMVNMELGLELPEDNYKTIIKKERQKRTHLSHSNQRQRRETRRVAVQHPTSRCDV